MSVNLKTGSSNDNISSIRNKPYASQSTRAKSRMTAGLKFDYPKESVKAKR